MTNRQLIEIRGACAGYDNNIVLKNIDLNIFDTDFIGVIGPNGGGKTTLIKLILRQMEPISGTITYTSDLANNIGYLPQISGIDKVFPISVEEVVTSGLQSRKGLFGRYKLLDRENVFNIMKRCSIDHLASKPISTLSGGQLQRAFLCRALVSKPKLLILDEPNTYVDNKFEHELYDLLQELNKDMAIIVVSHDVGTITSHIKSIACVNRTLHYHNSNIITQEELNQYDCPILMVAHGTIPHTVLKNH